jgi:SAM-dependent methyltransferase
MISSKRTGRTSTGDLSAPTAPVRKSPQIGESDPTGPNSDPATVHGFGEEWAHFDQSDLPREERRQQFEQYFTLFPWADLPTTAVGFDMGCGSGRWAFEVAQRVDTLHCIDASDAALDVARSNLGGLTNCQFHRASFGGIPLDAGSMDFGYSLGVLHHVPDTDAALAECVAKLKPNAPFLLYVYYDLENRPPWFRALWRSTDVLRRVISRLPFRSRLVVCTIIAAIVYWPLARLARLAERTGLPVRQIPLAAYRNKSFYWMRTDALDRFGTHLEKRYSRREVEQLMCRAGLDRVAVSDDEPFWCACGRRRL